MSTSRPAADYAGYLCLDELLAVQQPRAKPAAHDELMFIVVHQAYELWFKVLIHELEGIRGALLRRHPGRAKHLLSRAEAIVRVMMTQLEVLQTMQPQDYLEFRHQLDGGSGLHSVQFRVVEFLSGAKDSRLLSIYRNQSDLRELERRLAEPSVWEAFAGLLQSSVPLEAQEVGDALLLVAQDRHTYQQLWEIIGALHAYDRLAAQWRFRHVLLVESMIGTKPGTAGTTGVQYLRERVSMRYYPALWQLPAGM